jgi:hypothetical protein
MKKQVKYPVKVQSIKSKGQKERPYLFIPIPLAVAIGIEKGEEVEWELIDRNELHLFRPKAPEPSTKKRVQNHRGFSAESNVDSAEKPRVLKAKKTIPTEVEESEMRWYTAEKFRNICLSRSIGRV